MTNDEILDFIQELSDNKTGGPLSQEELQKTVLEGESRYEKEIPPGYKDGKKDGSGDPYRKFGDLIVWKQLISKCKNEKKSLIFVTDDKKEDWWTEQNGRTIGPRTELREEFIQNTGHDFWMYTVDHFIEEVAKQGKQTAVSETVLEEIRTVRAEVHAERQTSKNFSYYQPISESELLAKLVESERWSAKNEGFVGLFSFVRNYLGNLGYEYATSWDVIHELEQSGQVQIYDHQGLGHERPVKAIRIATKSESLTSRPLENLGEMANTSNAAAGTAAAAK